MFARSEAGSAGSHSKRTLWTSSTSRQIGIECTPCGRSTSHAPNVFLTVIVFLLVLASPWERKIVGRVVTSSDDYSDEKCPDILKYTKSVKVFAVAASSSQDEKDGLPLWIIVIICVLVALLIVIITVIVIVHIATKHVRRSKANNNNNVVVIQPEVELKSVEQPYGIEMSKDDVRLFQIDSWPPLFIEISAFS